MVGYGYFGQVVVGGRGVVVSEGLEYGVQICRDVFTEAASAPSHCEEKNRLTPVPVIHSAQCDKGRQASKDDKVYLKSTTALCLTESTNLVHNTQ